MKIVDVKAFIVGNPAPHHGGLNWVFLKLDADDGVVGYGEAYAIPFSPRAVLPLFENIGERFFIGADPFKIERLWRAVYTSGYDLHPDLTKMGVLSAFEMACWDIVGKELDQPIYKLLGGQYHERLRSYTYLYPSRSEREEFRLFDVFSAAERAAERAAEYVKQGFTAVRFWWAAVSLRWAGRRAPASAD